MDELPYKDAETRRVGRRISYQSRKETVLSQERGYRKTRPEGFRRTQYKRRYGITIEEFDAMVISQNGSCSLCKLPFKPRKTKDSKLPVHVDHCHKTLKVRGILCARCNLGLGFFGDDPDRLRAAIKYLEGTA